MIDNGRVTVLNVDLVRDTRRTWLWGKVYLRFRFKAGLKVNVDNTEEK